MRMTKLSLSMEVIYFVGNWELESFTQLELCTYVGVAVCFVGMDAESKCSWCSV